MLCDIARLSENIISNLRWFIYMALDERLDFLTPMILNEKPLI
ncbi:hypothetical protein [Pantoea sp. LMR881]|nr:hypothetical protein [Pantoea sp. LMR881]